MSVKHTYRLSMTAIGLTLAFFALFAVLLVANDRAIYLVGWMALGASIINLVSFAFLMVLHDRMHREAALKDIELTPIAEWPVLPYEYFLEAAKRLEKLRIQVYREDAERHAKKFQYGTVSDWCDWQSLLRALPEKGEEAMRLEEERELHKMMS